MKPLAFTLTGQMPSGKNQVNMTRTGHRYPNKRFVVWRADAIAQLYGQALDYAEHGTAFPLASTITLDCVYTPGDRRTRDVTGMLDALFHLLVKAKLLVDDGLVWGVTWRREGLDRDAPKLVFTMEVL